MANEIERKRGDTYPIELTLRAGGEVIDLTGATGLKLGVSDRVTVDGGGGGSNLLELDGALVEAATGQVKFDFTAGQAIALDPGDYFYDVSFKLGGVVFTTPTAAYRQVGRIAEVPA